MRQRWKTKYPHAQQNTKHCCLHTSRQRNCTAGYRLKNSTKHNKRCVRRFHVGETEYTAYYRCFHTNSHVLPHIDIKFDTLFLISATARQFARQVRFYNMHGQFANFPHKLCRQIILFNSAVCRKNVDTVVKIVYNVKQILRLRHKAQVLREFPQQKRITKKSLSLRLRCKHTLCKAKYSVQFLNMFRTIRQPDKLAFTLAKIVLCNFCC